jgi:hypothetical protein
MTPRRLLAPVPLATFLGEHWGESHLCVRGRAAKYARFFGWRDLNHLLATQRLDAPRLRLVRDGRDIRSRDPVLRLRAAGNDPQAAQLNVRALNRELARGATLVLNAVNEMHPPLADLARGFARLFLTEPNVNLYASCRRQPGYGPHWDDHDVFILQLAGRKRWLLYGPGRPHPLKRDARPNELQPLKPKARLLLKAGDLLYIPRGHWHDAIAVGEPTLHLTLGVATLTGIDFLKWLVDDVRSVASARRDIPLFDATARGAWLARVTGAARARFGPDGLSRYLEERRAVLHSSAPPALPYSVHAQLVPAANDGVRWTGAAHAALTRSAAGLTVRTLDHEYVFDPEAAPLVERLLQGKTIRYGVLRRSYARKLGPRRFQRFMSELLREHFVTIVPAR